MGALEAVPNEELGVRFFANRVSGIDGGFIESTEHYKILSLQVNCGISTPLSQEQSPEVQEWKKEFAKALPFINGTFLTVESPDGETLYYTIDLTPVTPEGWVVRVERTTTSGPRSFGVRIFAPGHEEETMGAHKLTNADLRELGADRCHATATSYSFPDGVRCSREDGHIGHHETFEHHDLFGEDREYFHEWEDKVISQSSPFGKFGFRNVCPYCGFVTAGGRSGEKTCFTCSYWLQQREAPAGFVIDGKHYRPGRGGYGGRIWNIQNNDGTTWTGELFGQGEIPARFRDLFPDTGKFLPEEDYDWGKKLTF